MQSGPDEMNQAGDASARATQRLNFFLGATLSCGELDGLAARVRNLSAGGMMIEFTADADPELETGQNIVAEIRNVGRIKGEIAWAESHRYGVRFAREIDPDLVRKPIAKRTGTPDHAKGLVLPDRSLKQIKSIKGW